MRWPWMFEYWCSAGFSQDFITSSPPVFLCPGSARVNPMSKLDLHQSVYSGEMWHNAALKKTPTNVRLRSEGCRWAAEAFLTVQKLHIIKELKVLTSYTYHGFRNYCYGIVERWLLFKFEYLILIQWYVSMSSFNISDHTCNSVKGL